MCKNCGCGHDHEHDHRHHGHDHHHDHGDGEHFHRDADGNLYSHRHTKTVPLGTAVLAANDEQAENNRKFFHDRGIRVINLISSPGSGKTALLERRSVWRGGCGADARAWRESHADTGA